LRKEKEEMADQWGDQYDQTSEGFFEVIVAAGESGVPPKPHPAVFDRCL
jgi:hypothetical protein